MARQLWERGNEVAMVGLFDATMSPLRWPLCSWLAIVRRRMVQFASGMIAAPMENWPWTVWKLGMSVGERLRGFLKSARTSVPKVTVRALIASARYRPGFYPGELTLFSPVGREPGLPSLQAVWSNHAGTLSTVEIPGTHSTMFSAINAESTAASLTRRLLVCTGRTPRPFAASPHAS